MDLFYTPEENDIWDRFYHPDADDEDPPTLDEIRILREFVDHYGTPQAIAVNEAARNFMSLCNVDRHGGIVGKGERVGWLLWDVGIEMLHYQPAILKLVEVIRALPGIDRTEKQIRVWQFKERLERWRDMEAFYEMWFRLMNVSGYSLHARSPGCAEERWKLIIIAGSLAYLLFPRLLEYILVYLERTGWLMYRLQVTGNSDTLGMDLIAKAILALLTPTLSMRFIL